MLRKLLQTCLSVFTNHNGIPCAWTFTYSWLKSEGQMTDPSHCLEFLKLFAFHKGHFLGVPWRMDESNPWKALEDQTTALADSTAVLMIVSKPNGCTIGRCFQHCLLSLIHSGTLFETESFSLWFPCQHFHCHAKLFQQTLHVNAPVQNKQSCVNEQHLQVDQSPFWTSTCASLLGVIWPSTCLLYTSDAADE